jgi:tetratricopeptide (TPR) repeat protein
MEQRAVLRPYHYHGDWELATSYFEESLAICRELGDSQGEGQTLNNLTTIYAMQEQWQKAISHYERALALKRETGDREHEASTIINLGNCYEGLKRWTEAAAYYREALRWLNCPKIHKIDLRSPM